MSGKTTELKTLSKLKKAGKLRYWRGTIEIPETELHAICDEIQAEHEQTIAATLGSSTLTAEQVRECVRVVYFDGYSDGSVNRGQHLEETDWEAIADELNAELGSGTCELIDLAHNAWSMALCAMQGMPIPAEWGDKVEQGLRKYGINVDEELTGFEVIDE